jgi:hypothetical protein
MTWGLLDNERLTVVLDLQKAVFHPMPKAAITHVN